MIQEIKRFLIELVVLSQLIKPQDDEGELVYLHWLQSFAKPSGEV